MPPLRVTFPISYVGLGGLFLPALLLRHPDSCLPCCWPQWDGKSVVFGEVVDGCHIVPGPLTHVHPAAGRSGMASRWCLVRWWMAAT